MRKFVITLAVFFLLVGVLIAQEQSDSDLKARVYNENSSLIKRWAKRRMNTLRHIESNEDASEETPVEAAVETPVEAPVKAAKKSVKDYLRTKIRKALEKRIKSSDASETKSQLKKRIRKILRSKIQKKSEKKNRKSRKLNKRRAGKKSRKTSRRGGKKAFRFLRRRRADKKVEEPAETDADLKRVSNLRNALKRRVRSDKPRRSEKPRRSLRRLSKRNPTEKKERKFLKRRGDRKGRKFLKRFGRKTAKKTESDSDEFRPSSLNVCKACKYCSYLKSAEAADRCKNICEKVCRKRSQSRKTVDEDEMAYYIRRGIRNHALNTDDDELSLRPVYTILPYKPVYIDDDESISEFIKKGVAAWRRFRGLSEDDEPELAITGSYTKGPWSVGGSHDFQTGNGNAYGKYDHNGLNLGISHNWDDDEIEEVEEQPELAITGSYTNGPWSVGGSHDFQTGNGNAFGNYDHNGLNLGFTHNWDDDEIEEVEEQPELAITGSYTNGPWSVGGSHDFQTGNGNAFGNYDHNGLNLGFTHNWDDDEVVG